MRSTARDGCWWITGTAEKPVVDGFETDQPEENTALIIAAVNALPALLDVAEAARAQRRAEQMLSDASLSNPDRYLQTAEMLVEAKRALRAALDRLDGAS